MLTGARIPSTATEITCGCHDGASRYQGMRARGEVMTALQGRADEPSMAGKH